MPLLRVCDLVKSYSGPEGLQPVLDIPAFELEAGAEVALRGSSGSGKTTFLHLVAGIVRADQGQIWLDGTDLTQLNETRRDQLRARCLGYVFQSFHLLQGLSALENVLLGMAFGPGPDRRQASALLERLGLGDRLRYKPRQLSSGQQQRVALARALANRPRLVLADEPTGNLDARRAQEALDLLREVCREAGAALLVVSHDEAVLGRFERVVSLNEINRVASP